MAKKYIIPIFVPHFGCPHDCIFCNQKKITNVSTTTTAEDVEQEIEKYLSYFPKAEHVEVAFYGGSFTAINMDIQSELLQVPYEYKKKGIIKEIRLSTRPDAINSEILENLEKYGVDTIELGVQSLDDGVLKCSARGHSAADVYRAVDLIREYDFKLGLQMMVGLPMDSSEKSIKTAKEFIRLKPDLVRIYPTLVINETYLNKLYERGLYQPLSIDEAVDICTRLLMMFYVEDIKVIRVGLQPTDNIQLGMDVVAGPFHPAFRQLVEANIYRLLIEDYLKDRSKADELIIGASRRETSNIAGQKSSNIKYIKEKYGIKKVKILPWDIEDGRIYISIDGQEDLVDKNSWMKDYIRQI